MLFKVVCVINVTQIWASTPEDRLPLPLLNRKIRYIAKKETSQSAIYYSTAGLLCTCPYMLPKYHYRYFRLRSNFQNFAGTDNVLMIYRSRTKLLKSQVKIVN